MGKSPHVTPVAQGCGGGVRPDRRQGGQERCRRCRRRASVRRHHVRIGELTANVVTPTRAARFKEQRSVGSPAECDADGRSGEGSDRTTLDLGKGQVGPVTVTD
jgi:hypothetical protein